MDSLQKPLISVVLCTYNGQSFLKEQLESVCHQTYTNLEIIIVDDHSTDETGALLKLFAAGDNRINLYFNEQNLGYNQNFSRACGLATGEYIAIADQDDIWELAKLEKMLSALGNNPGAILAYCSSVMFSEKENRRKKFTPYIFSTIRPFFLRNFIPGHCMLFRTRLLMLARPFPPGIYYDWWLAVVAGCNGGFASVPEVLVWHRRHGENVTEAAHVPSPCHEIMSALPVMLQAPGMKRSDKVFGETLFGYCSSAVNKGKRLSYFLFLLRHAGSLFHYKKQVFPWPSYFRKALRYSRTGSRP